MPFIPSEPQNGEIVDADFLRSQFNSLNDKIEPVTGGTVGPAGLQITGNDEGATTVGLVFLKADGVTDSGYRLNYNDDTDGVLILRNGVPVAGVEAEGLRVFGPLAAHGAVRLTGLPAADPHVAGQSWKEAGTLKISAG